MVVKLGDNPVVSCIFGQIFRFIQLAIHKGGQVRRNSCGM